MEVPMKKPVRPAQPTCSAIVCAYNEENHLAAVLDGLLGAAFVQEIIVVDDGSTDHTAEIMREYSRFERITPIFIEYNQGKGNAMAKGAEAARGDILLYVDADLVNWDASYALQVLQPVLDGKADLVIGYPRREHDAWDSADLLRIQRWLSGERAVWRADLLPLLPKMHPSRFGVETLINMHYKTRHQPIRMIPLKGLLHPLKFEKSSRAEAWDEYVKEVGQILNTYARHPKLTFMTYMPDLYDVRDALTALYGFTRRTISGGIM
jgi:glycosyltransferase involved in cell wall biosynthesis